MMRDAAVFASLFAAVGVTLAYIWFLADSAIRAHDLPTTDEARRKVADIIRERAPKGKVLVDLGCARGRFATAMKKEFPAWNVRGVDASGFRLAIAAMRSIVRGVQVRWEKADIFTASVADADVIYTYLWYDTMPPLEKKIWAQAKKGAIVITNTSKFPNWKPVAEYIVHDATPDFEKLFVYERP